MPTRVKYGKPRFLPGFAFAMWLLIFFITPIVEMYLLIEVGGYIGAWPTIGLVMYVALASSSAGATDSALPEAAAGAGAAGQCPPMPTGSFCRQHRHRRRRIRLQYYRWCRQVRRTGSLCR